MKEKIKNLYRKAKDVVMTIGSRVVQKLQSAYTNCVNALRKTAKAALVAIGISTAILAPSAQAAVPADVTTAITTAVTDVATIGGAVIVVFVAIKAWKWLRGIL